MLSALGLVVDRTVLELIATAALLLGAAGFSLGCNLYHRAQSRYLDLEARRKVYDETNRLAELERARRRGERATELGRQLVNVEYLVHNGRSELIALAADESVALRISEIASRRGEQGADYRPLKDKEWIDVTGRDTWSRSNEYSRRQHRYGETSTANRSPRGSRAGRSGTGRT